MALQGNSGISYVVAAVSTLSDVLLTNPQPGQSLTYDGDKWINASAGNGTVTSIAVSGGAGVVVDGSPITGAGTIDIAVSALPTSKIQGGAFGRLFFATNTTAAGQDLLGGGAVGIQLYQTSTTAAANGVLGAGAAGLQVYQSPTTANAQAALGFTPFSQSFIAVSTTAAAQNQLGVGTAGRQLFQATTTAAAQQQLGFGAFTQNFVPVATTAAAVSNLGAGAVGAQVFAVATTAALQAIVGAGSGTVTSAGVSGGNGITVVGSPITTQGVITLGLGDITPISINTSTGRFTGMVSAEAGIRTTTVSAASIGLTGNLTANQATVSALTATGRGTFGGIVSAAGINSTNGISGSAGTFTGSVSAGSVNVTGDILAQTGKIITSAANITAKLSANTADFNGRVSANSIQFTTTTGIVGTTTNDSAAAGSVGQILEAENSAGTANSLTTSSAANVLTLPLTAGDWDVYGNVFFIAAGTTQGASWNAAINTVSQTFPANSGRGAYVFFSDTSVAGRNMSFTGLRTSIKVATSANAYLLALATFTTSTMTAYGYIAARRVR